MKIQDLRAREIIDCKGKPLLEVDIITEDGTMGRAASPSGISAGEHEAMVLRDGDRSRYDGNGVRKAVEMAEKVVLPAIQGMDVLDQQALDRRLMELDGTPNKSRLGGNVTYSTSLAVMRAGCQLRHVSQYRYLNPGDIRTIPLPTSDMFAGGSYEDDTMPVQETTIVPYKASSIAEATEILCKVYKKLPEVIREFQGAAVRRSAPCRSIWPPAPISWTVWISSMRRPSAAAARRRSPSIWTALSARSTTPSGEPITTAAGRWIWTRSSAS